MSTDTNDEEEAEVTESAEEELIKPISVFINNVDSYQGQAIVKLLPLANTAVTNPAYNIYGTIKDFDIPQPVNIRSLISGALNPSSCHFVDSVIENDVIIYDIGSDNTQIEEAQKVLDGLEKYYNKIKDDKSKEGVVKYFILISTPLTWAKTPPIDEDSNVLTEEHYRKRRNHPCYVKHKCLEREVINLQKRCKPNIRTVVVCPGFTYGEANDIFHYLFKLAFYNKEMIPLFKPGNNYVPLLYIHDFARMIKQIIDEFPEPSKRYILAVQPRQISMKTFARTIVYNLAGNVTKIKLVSPEEVLQTYEELISARVFHAVTMNIKMAPSYFEDFEFSFEENFEEFGTIVTDEFRKARNLLPIKVIIDGPPAVGKTTLAKCITEFYQLHYINVENVIYIVLKSLTEDISQTEDFLQSLDTEKKESDEEDQDQDIQDDLLDMEDRLHELLAEWKVESKEIAEFIEIMEKGTDANLEMEFQLKKRCLLKIISSKACHENQGYVLDGFPFEYSQAEEIFPKTSAEGEEAEEDGGTLSELRPDFVFLLDAPDELLCKRAMSLTETEARDTKSTEQEFLLRLEAFRGRNQEDKSLLSFFYDNGIIPTTFCINENTQCGDIFEKIKAVIGAPHIYPMSKLEKEALIRWQNEMAAQKEMEERRIKEEAAAREREEREANLCKWTKEFERLKCKEQEILEAKTLPLRQYLAKFVLPTLTDGLVRVAETRPEDPVDFLAEYLFECNPTGYVLDPVYSRKMKKLLLDECDEDISKALDMMAENETEFDCGIGTKYKSLDSQSTSSASTSNKKQRYIEENNLARMLMRELREKKYHQ